MLLKEIITSEDRKQFITKHLQTITIIIVIIVIIIIVSESYR